MSTFYQNASFLLSAPDLRSAPVDEGWEIAFGGRSNAGKSSALNAITNRRNLARTSKTPGRTQQLVFFALDQLRRLVDLPGYGYARVGEQTRERWRRALESYFRQRRSLRGLVLTMDIRHPFTDYDRMMLEFCAVGKLPVHILLTKADKLGRGAAKAILLTAETTVTELHDGCTVQLFSAANRTGIDDARQVLNRWLNVASVAADGVPSSPR